MLKRLFLSIAILLFSGGIFAQDIDITDFENATVSSGIITAGTVTVSGYNVNPVPSLVVESGNTYCYSGFSTWSGIKIDLTQYDLKSYYVQMDLKSDAANTGAKIQFGSYNCGLTVGTTWKTYTFYVNVTSTYNGFVELIHDTNFGNGGTMISVDNIKLIDKSLVSEYMLYDFEDGGILPDGWQISRTNVDNPCKACGNTSDRVCRMDDENQTYGGQGGTTSCEIFKTINLDEYVIVADIYSKQDMVLRCLIGAETLTPPLIGAEQKMG